VFCSIPFAEVGGVGPFTRNRQQQQDSLLASSMQQMTLISLLQQAPVPPCYESFVQTPGQQVSDIVEWCYFSDSCISLNVQL
jgi:hypothetical protein